jgi:hypothetical protein
MLLALCHCSSAPSGALQIVTGGEQDTFSRAPAPVTLEIDAVDSTGVTKRLATAPLPTATVDLGSLPTSQVATLEVTGRDPDGARIVFGETLPIELGTIDGATLPIFVQRTGELARMPAPLSDARPAPTLAVLGGRYLFVGGGSDPSLAQTIQLYDFAQLAPVTSPPRLPRAPKSVAVLGLEAWLIDEGGATEFDFSGQTQAFEVVAPPGGTFGDVAGGITVFAPDGSQYVVGATRTAGAPTATVLAIDGAGGASWKFLTEPRLGAAATWVDGRGLVVAGGSATAAGVEIVAASSAVGSALPYPPDPSSGAGAARLDAQHVILAGGVTPSGEGAAARNVDLGCTAPCAPAVWAPLPVTLVSAQVFASDAAHVLVVGNEAAGATHVYTLTAAGAAPVPTRVPHSDARATVSPVGSVVIVGGAGAIESFVP